MLDSLTVLGYTAGRQGGRSRCRRQRGLIGMARCVACHAVPFILAVTFLAVAPPPAGADTDPLAWRSRPGTTNWMYCQPVGTRVTLDVLMVWDIGADHLILREPFRCEHQFVRVNACADVKRWQCVEVEGTIGGAEGSEKYIVDARVYAYLDSKGRLLSMVGKPLWGPPTWVTTVDVALASGEAMTLESEPESLPPAEGTIAYAKYAGGAVSLADKVVTAVFNYLGNEFFYIQEPTDDPQHSWGGIRVSPSQRLALRPGDEVSVSGTVVGAPAAECAIVDAAVQVTGTADVPKPVGVCQRWTAGGAFFLQPALYTATYDPAVPGVGLSLVGTLVRVWGKVTSIDYQPGRIVVYIEDGSGLSCLSGRAMRQGIGLVYSSDCPASRAVGDYVEGVTGVLGAEMSDDPAHPVPVVRVPCPAPVCIKYAKPGGTGDGSSWTQAAGSVQDAMDAACSEAGGPCEVWVSAGTYQENIELCEGVSVFGGFTGIESEQVREQRDWTANVVTLGNYGNSIVTMPLDSQAVCRIDGFTITGGYLGAGISCMYCPALISNNTIVGNNAVGYDGRGVYCLSSSVLIWGNTITDNLALNGAGVMCDASEALITNNTISGNGEGGYGSCAYGGGIYCYESNPTISDNTITGNTATSYGGGIYIAYTPPGSVPSISGNVIANNAISGTGVVEGGGIHLEDSPALITGNYFHDNYGGDHGGAIAVHGDDHLITVANNLFVRNHASGAEGSMGGGAVHLRDALARIVNNTFVENWVGSGEWPEITPAAYGGAVHVRYSSQARLINNIFSGNLAVFGCSLACTEVGAADVSYCDAWPGGETENYHAAQDSSYDLAARCIYVLPGFYDPLNSQYWLGGSSLLRTVPENHGQNHWNDPDVPEEDIDGRPRPGMDGLTDMGAYENDLLP